MLSLLKLLALGIFYYSIPCVGHGIKLNIANSLVIAVELVFYT